jgi:hypothetical protein
VAFQIRILMKCPYGFLLQDYFYLLYRAQQLKLAAQADCILSLSFQPNDQLVLRSGGGDLIVVLLEQQLAPAQLSGRTSSAMRRLDSHT